VSTIRLRIQVIINVPFSLRDSNSAKPLKQMEINENLLMNSEKTGQLLFEVATRIE